MQRSLHVLDALLSHLLDQFYVYARKSATGRFFYDACVLARIDCSCDVVAAKSVASLRDTDCHLFSGCLSTLPLLVVQQAHSYDATQKCAYHL